MKTPYEKWIDEQSEGYCDDCGDLRAHCDCRFVEDDPDYLRDIQIDLELGL